MSGVLVTALFGGLGVIRTLAGVLLTQLGTTRRDKDQWNRSVERQNRAWAREDERRTFEQRCEAYVEFELQVRLAAVQVEQTSSSFDFEDGWNDAAFQSMLRLQIFATPEAIEAADRLYLSLLRWGEGGDSESSYDDAHARFMSVVRRDLHVAPRSSDSGSQTVTQGSSASSRDRLT